MICDFKVNCLQVSETPYDKERLSTIPAVNYEFPDGTRRNFGADRFAIAEALFEPNSIKEANETVLGVADIIAKSVAMCDTGMRQVSVSLFFVNAIAVSNYSIFFRNYTAMLSLLAATRSCGDSRSDWRMTCMLRHLRFVDNTSSRFWLSIGIVL